MPEISSAASRPPETASPERPAAVAETLAAAAADGRAVRVLGAGTKAGWGNRGTEPGLILQTTRLNRTIEHNVGDLTAIFEAGVPLARAQSELADAGQMLAVDPPLGAGDGTGATIGGVFATGDCGPLRHRYGEPRDLILGITVALADGTLAKAGGKVIKNVAGYDLAKLFTGSFGTLGVIVSVSVRLHPLAVQTVTARGATADPAVLSAAAVRLAAAPLELEALDFAWRGGRGGLLAQVSGPEAPRRAQRVAELMRDAGLDDAGTIEDDSSTWERQRAGQRSAKRALLRVAIPPSRLGELLVTADLLSATVVGRAAFGTAYLEFDPARVRELRAELSPRIPAVVLDLPDALRDGVDAWGAAEDPALDLMRSVKARFDPGAICNPGVFAGGI